MENADKAGYTVRMFPGLLWGGSVSWAYNYTSNDAVLREIFNDLRFRRAMSHAINREEFAEVFNLGLTEPRQAAPPADWSFYDETFGRKYLEYDIDLANQLLDEMGLPWDADRRHRLRPDGKPLILQTEIGQEGHRPGEWEFIIRYWSKVGVEVKYKQVDHALYAQHLLANELEHRHLGRRRATGIGEPRHLPDPPGAAVALARLLCLGRNGMARLVGERRRARRRAAAADPGVVRAPRPVAGGRHGHP